MGEFVAAIDCCIGGGVVVLVGEVFETEDSGAVVIVGRGECFSTTGKDGFTESILNMSFEEDI